MSTRRRTHVPGALIALAAMTAACGGRVGLVVADRDPQAPPLNAAAPVTAASEAPPAPRSVAEEEVPQDRRWAVVVGANDYPGTKNDLSGAVADARTMARALRGLGFPKDHVRVVLQGDATGAAILESARWLAARTRAGHTGVFMFAGHGMQVAGDPDGDGEELDEVLVGSDFARVTDGELAEALRPAEGAMWLVFAACNAGGFDDAAAPGRVLTFASGENRLAWESPDFGSSFLVEFMVRRALIDEGLADPESAFRRARGLMAEGYRRYRPLQMDLHPGPLWLATEPSGGP